MARIASYDYELEIREGKKHANADGMSRCRQCKREECPADGTSKRELRYDSDEDLLPEISGENWRDNVALIQENLNIWTEDLFCGDDIDMVCQIDKNDVFPLENFSQEKLERKEDHIISYGLRKRKEKKETEVSDENLDFGLDRWLSRFSESDIKDQQEKDPDLRAIIQ